MDTDIKNNVISSIIQDERCVRVRVHVPVRVRVWVCGYGCASIC